MNSPKININLITSASRLTKEKTHIQILENRKCGNEITIRTKREVKAIGRQHGTGVTEEEEALSVFMKLHSDPLCMETCQHFKNKQFPLN